MITRRTFLAALGPAVAATAVSAEYVGPSIEGAHITVALAKDARVGTYHTLEGNIVAHLRQDFYLFRDPTGDLRVEIEPSRFHGHKVAPDDKVKLMGEIEVGDAGLRYLWVKKLEVIS